MKKIILGILFLCPVMFSLGQEVAPKTSYKKGQLLGVHFNFYDFQTAADLKEKGLSEVLEEGQWYKTSRMNLGLAVSFTKGLSENVDLMTRFGGSLLKYPIPGKTLPANDKLYLEADASVNLKLLPDNYFVSPYVSAGFGASAWSGYFGAYLPAGLGLQVNLFEETFIFIQAQYRVPVTTGTTARHLFYGFGIAGNITKKKEPVVVPPPPPPVMPSDSDGDGVIDSEDACPTVAGIVKYKGCPVPDSDKDGIDDENDKCPSVAGLAKFQGCPDKDNDGIQDSEDKCPDVSGLAKYNGCPVPDTDKDGVNDEEDNCPTIAGEVENQGCPTIKLNIQFVTGSAVLTKKDKAELDKAVKILNEEFPDLKVAIEGHTDNTGKQDKNQVLSEKRALAVKKYFVSQKVAEDRLTSAGYGQDKPVADNSTKEGRKMNRRVNFRVSQK